MQVPLGRKLASSEVYAACSAVALKVDSRLLSLVSRIIFLANTRHPADAVLAAELRRARRLARTDSTAVTKAVFAYYRWLGWLDQRSSVEGRISEALDLDRAFQANPSAFSDQDLVRAVPGWVIGQMIVSGTWLRSLQTPPKLWLRARPGKARELGEKLGDCWVPDGGLLRDAVRYEGEEDLFRTPEFHAGEFEVQDISSQAVGILCNPQPGEVWWDACAGQGGKLLHLSDLMQNKGLLWASDRAAWRLQKLRRRAARAGVFNYRPVRWDGGKRLPTQTKFDGVLLDAPCSGLGTWQRNPHARWTASLQDVNELSVLQTQLLSSIVPALKPAGRLIYSVCTLTVAETFRVADAISRRFPWLTPLQLINPINPAEPASSRLMLWPQSKEGNGMFVCGWQKQASYPVEGNA